MALFFRKFMVIILAKFLFIISFQLAQNQSDIGGDKVTRGEK